MVAGKALQLVQRASGLEGLGVQLQRGRRGVTARAADRLFLQRRRMRRAVGAEEKAVAARCGRGHQRLAVHFALEHRQAVEVRPQAAHEQRVAVVEQVVGGDGGGGEAVGAGHVLGGFAGGDVFEHHLQLGEVAPQRRHHAVDEHGLAVEEVDLAIGHLAVHQQQQAGALHGLQRRVGLADVGDAGVAVGGGAGRVELERHHTGIAWRAGSRPAACCRSGTASSAARSRCQGRSPGAPPGCARGRPAPSPRSSPAASGWASRWHARTAPRWRAARPAARRRRAGAGASRRGGGSSGWKSCADSRTRPLDAAQAAAVPADTRNMITRTLLPLAAVALLGACATPEPLGPVAKEEIVAVTVSNQLLRFNAGQPQAVRDRKPLTGLRAGEKLLGIDYRVARGELFALGASGQLYKIDVAQRRGHARRHRCGAAGRWRGLGLRFQPDRGPHPRGQQQRREPAPAPGHRRAGAPPMATWSTPTAKPAAIVAAGYTYNKSNDKITTNYALDGAAGTLVHQGSKEGVTPAVSPNTGQIFSVGSLGVGPFAHATFDISDVSNAAYAGLRTAGATATRWHQVDLASGKARFIGTVGGGEALVGAAIEP